MELYLDLPITVVLKRSGAEDEELEITVRDTPPESGEMMEQLRELKRQIDRHSARAALLPEKKELAKAAGDTKTLKALIKEEEKLIRKLERLTEQVEEISAPEVLERIAKERFDATVSGPGAARLREAAEEIGYRRIMTAIAEEVAAAGKKRSSGSRES